MRLGSEDQEGGCSQSTGAICPQVSIPCPRETLPCRELCWGLVKRVAPPRYGLDGGESIRAGPCPLTPHPPLQEFSGSSPKRRRAEDKDEGIGSPDIWEDEKAEDLRREMIELRQQLDKERSVRMMLEEQVRPCGARSRWTHPLTSFSPSGAPWECWCGWSVPVHLLWPPLCCAWLWAPWLCCGHCMEWDSPWLGIWGCCASSRLGSPPMSGLSWPAGSLPGGPHVPREAEGDCSASAAPAAAGAGEVAAPGEARARAADPNPGECRCCPSPPQ